MGENSRQRRLQRLRWQLQMAREDGHDHEILLVESLIAELERQIAAERSNER